VAKTGRKRGRPRKQRPQERSEPAAPAHNEEAARHHNMGERRDEMRRALSHVYELETEIRAIIESDVKPLRSDRSEIIKSVRERFGMPANIFKARYRSYQIERDAQAANDEITQDAIRELFEVAPVNGQGSFVFDDDLPRSRQVEAEGSTTTDQLYAEATRHFAKASALAGARAMASVPKPGDAEDPEAAWAAGDEARRANKVRGSNPHRKGTALSARWFEGWDAANAELIRAAGGAPPQIPNDVEV